MCPCKECIALAMCMNRKELRCSLLLNFLNRAEEISSYPEFPDILSDMRETLNGNWCIVGVNNQILRVVKDYKPDPYPPFR